MGTPLLVNLQRYTVMVPCYLTLQLSVQCIYGTQLWLSLSLQMPQHCMLTTRPSAHTMLNTNWSSRFVWLLWFVIFFLRPDDMIQNDHQDHKKSWVPSSVNSLRQSEAYMHWSPRSSLVQIMACRLFGAKPLSKPMLGYCQLYPQEQTSVKFLPQLIHFHSWKCIWKCRLQNDSHFVSASMC